MSEPSMHTLTIRSETSASVLTETLRKVLVEKALPVLEQCATLEGVLGYYIARKNPNMDALSAAGVCLLLGRDAEARKYMDEAKSLAAHENDLRWLGLREKSMWANRSETHVV